MKVLSYFSDVVTQRSNSSGVILLVSFFLQLKQLIDIKFLWLLRQKMCVTCHKRQQSWKRVL